MASKISSLTSELRVLTGMRPGPQHNPHPQKGLPSAKELAHTLEEIAPLSGWTPDAAKLAVDIATAIKKNDRRKGAQLLRKLQATRQVSAGTLNEIQMWIDGQIT